MATRLRQADTVAAAANRDELIALYRCLASLRERMATGARHVRR
jgi:hypothetical protein